MGRAKEAFYARDFSAPIFDAIRDLYKERPGARNGLAVYLGADTLLITYM